MEFEKVTKEHILKAIKDFEEKGMPKDFGPSSTYDLVFNGKEYPPKAVMAYANFRAIGKEINLYFKGGTGTDSFKAFENNGFEIVAKDERVIYFSIIEKLKAIIPESKFKFKSTNGHSRSIWIEDAEKIIGSKDAHYELILRKKNIHLELHFENYSSQKFFKEGLKKNYPKLDYHTWQSSLRFNYQESFSVNEKDVHLRMARALKDFDAIIGDDVRAVIKRVNNMKVDNKKAFKDYLIKNTLLIVVLHLLILMHWSIYQNQNT
jgi:hypothetical protein